MDYYLQLTEQAEPHLLGPEQLQWFDRLGRDLDNLWAILQVATIGGAEVVELALRLASALRVFWVGRGYFHEGRSVLEQLLAQAGAIAAPVRLKALRALGMILWIQNDAHRLAQVANETLALARKQGDQLQMTIGLILHGEALMQGRRDDAQAQACLEEALASARALGDRECLVIALLSLGGLALYQQDALRASARFEEGLTLCRATGEKVLMGVGLFQLARAELSLSQTARARTLLEESLSLYQALGNRTAIALILDLLGQLAFQRGELSQARALLTESAGLASEVGDRRNVARSRLLLAGVAALRGDYAVARQWYEEGLSTALEVGHTNYIGAGLKGLGCVAAAQGLPTWAALLWGTAELLRESRSVAIPQAFYDRMVAVVRSQLGEPVFEEARARGRTMTPALVLASPEAFAPQVPQQAQATPGATPSVPTDHPSSPAGLTAREMEVLRLVAQGKTDAQIAEHLVISPRTVNWHLTSIYSKLGVSSRSAATRYALDHSLV